VNGNLTEFDATFTQHCESSSAPPLEGTIHFHGSTGPPPTTTTVSTSTTSTTMPPITTTTSPPSTTTVPPSPAPVSIDVDAVNFGRQRVGTFGRGALINVRNRSRGTVRLTRLAIVGRNPVDFFGSTDCATGGRLRVLVPGASCRIGMFFAPLQPATRTASLVIGDDAGSPAQMVSMRGVGTEGYFVAGAKGEVGTFGDAVFHGDATGINLAAPIISMATTPNGAGYWLLARDGGIFSYGNAAFHGSTGATHLNRPIVAMSATRDGHGYRLVGSDGGIFAFGDARFYGSTGGIHLNQPVDGMAATVDDRGYWLVAADGGIFAFGDAHFYGSAATAHLTSPVIQITPTPSGRGYWVLTGDGHLYAYGDAHVYGTATGQHTVGMAATPDGRGYWEATQAGRIYNFGDARSYGDIRNLGVNDVVGISGTAPPLPPSLLPAAVANSRAAANSLALSPTSISVRHRLGPELELDTPRSPRRT
jgi:hypothetical protein